LGANPIGRARLWPSGVALTVAAALAAIVALRGNHIDFEVYLRAGQRLLSDADSLYRTPGELPFTYPPFAGLLAAPLAGWPLFWLAVLALATVVVAAWPTARVLRDAGWTSHPASHHAALLVAVAMCSEPVLRSLHLGQVNGLVLLLVFVDVLLVPPRWRGVLVGVAAGIKLTPLVVLLHFVARRDWGAVGRCLAAFALTVGIGFAALPSASSAFWTALVRSPERVGDPAFIDNQSLRGLVERLDVGHASAVWMAASLAVVVVGARVLVRLRAGSPLESLLVSLLVGVLVSPISWSHHWIVVPALGALVVARVGVTTTLTHRVLAWAALAAVVLGPHWLVRDEDPSGPTDIVTFLWSNAMVAGGLVLLALVALAWRPAPRSSADDRPTEALHPAP